MVKFVGYVDYKAGCTNEFGQTYKYFDMIAKTVDEAMNEIESAMNPDVYLVDIYVKSGKKTKIDSHDSYTEYTRKFVNRGNGFHVADDKHSEHVGTVERHEIKWYNNIDIHYEYRW